MQAITLIKADHTLLTVTGDHNINIKKETGAVWHLKQPQLLPVCLLPYVSVFSLPHTACE